VVWVEGSTEERGELFMVVLEMAFVRRFSSLETSLDGVMLFAGD
jgi:hypothetical protein